MSIYLVVVVAGSEETDAQNCQVEEVADGRFRIDAIPKEKTGDVAKLERHSFSSQDSLFGCKQSD